MKRIISLSLVLIVCALALSSCGVFDHARRGEEATKGFLACLETDDYMSAGSYLHSASDIPKIELKSAIEALEDDLNIDFSEKTELTAIYSMETMMYPFTEYGEATLVHFVFEGNIGEKPVYIQVIYLEDDRGGGIYDFAVSLSSAGSLSGSLEG